MRNVQRVIETAWFVRVRRIVMSRHTRRALTAVSIAAAVTIPVLTLRGVPKFSPWPVLIGLVPWMIGKYVLCPLRWHSVSESGRSRFWHMTTYAEAELFGLLTPGHVGSDVWRVRRLCRGGMPRMSAVTEVCLDRFVGAVGLVVFVAFAATTLPVRTVVLTFGSGVLGLLLVLLVRRLKPEWVPERRLPPARQLVHGLLLSIAYQATIVALLLGAVLSTGYSLSPLGLMGAFGVSQLAGAVPGPQGASPRDGALVVALAALGIPWVAALGAVTLKALLAWAPALLFGGSCLLVAKRYGNVAVLPVVAEAA